MTSAGVGSAAVRQLLAPLADAEHTSLKVDVAEQGVLVPAVVGAETGEIPDDSHRVKAWDELQAKSISEPDHPRETSCRAVREDRRDGHSAW